MIRVLGFCLLYMLAISPSASHSPRFFAMDKEYLQVAEEEETFLISGQDTSLQHQVYLLKDTSGADLLYYAPIVTPVCIDGKCKPVHISLYWNLIGNYVGYGIPPSIPLSKYDHESFEEGDYQRLHQLLLDDKSVLKRKKLEDLFDKNARPEKTVRYKGEEIDGVTGATKKEIKESLVAGALYSCYTVWHLAHGEVKDSIESKTLSDNQVDLNRTLLYSSYQDYQHFAIRRLDSLELLQHLPRLVEILPKASPLTRTYLLKKLPLAAYAHPEQSAALYNQLPQIDLNTKTLLIRKLIHASDRGIESCFSHLSALSKNQIKACLTFLEQNPTKRTERVEALLLGFSENEDFSYHYLLSAFLGK